MEHVRVESENGVAVVTLVDVERRNAMTAVRRTAAIASGSSITGEEAVSGLLPGGGGPGGGKQGSPISFLPDE